MSRDLTFSSTNYVDLMILSADGVVCNSEAVLFTKRIEEESKSSTNFSCDNQMLVM